jgi:hypothetical protein
LILPGIRIRGKARMSSSPPEDSPEDLYLRAFEKAAVRKQSGCDPLAADWQAILEIALNLARSHLRRHPGRLLPLQIGDDEEWEFYLDLLERLDLPPDTFAVLSTPSFSESLFDVLDDPEFEVPQGCKMPWEKNTYLVIISDCRDHVRIMQVTLPSASGAAGIDVYEDGKHLADYTYHTIEECMDALAKVPWVFFSPRHHWTPEQVVQYTENWFVKGVDTQNLEGMVIHEDRSYVHHPELLDLTALEAIFRLLEATVPAALENLETAINSTNDLNQDLEPEGALVTLDGILKEHPEQCQALAGRIAIEMDQQLEELERTDGIPFPDRNDPVYVPAFDEAVRRIYEKIVGHPCPESVSVQ